MWVKALIVFGLLWFGQCDDEKGPSWPSGGPATPVVVDVDGGPGTAEGKDPDHALGGRCTLPAVAGSCEARFRNYYFDTDVQACRPFYYGGCEGNENNFRSLEQCRQACEAGADLGSECWVEATDPSLPRVQIHLEGDSCELARGVGGQFRYWITAGEPISYTPEEPADACVPCDDDGPQALAALSRFEIAGGDFRYAPDEGRCCAAESTRSTWLTPNIYEMTVDWSGRASSGSSGPRGRRRRGFPPGQYQVEVSLEVPGVGAVTARLPIRVSASRTAGSQADPLGMPCEIDGNVYPSGTGLLPDPESCNTCLCDEGQLVCSERACP